MSPPRLLHPALVHQRVAARRLAALGACLLVGCGGGGDTASTQSIGGNPPPAAQATCSLSDFQNELLQRVNTRRAAGGSCGSRGSFAPSPALQWNGALTQAAAAHSLDMASHDYFAHDSQDGRTPGERITQAGYAWRTYGENIAAGYGSVQAVVDGWMASDGHCANILNPAFRDLGVACVPGAGTATYSSYWTMDLGAP